MGKLLSHGYIPIYPLCFWLPPRNGCSFASHDVHPTSSVTSSRCPDGPSRRKPGPGTRALAVSMIACAASSAGGNEPDVGWLVEIRTPWGREGRFWIVFWGLKQGGTFWGCFLPVFRRRLCFRGVGRHMNFSRVLDGGLPDWLSLEYEC